MVNKKIIVLIVIGIFVVISITTFYFLFRTSVGRHNMPKSQVCASEAGMINGNKPIFFAKYASVKKGLSVYDNPGRENSEIFKIPLAAKVDILETKEIPYQEITETWAKVKWNNKTGWTLSYYLVDAEQRGSYLEKADITPGYWQMYSDGHPVAFSFNEDGNCEVSYCENSQEARQISANYFRQVRGRSWEIKDDSHTRALVVYENIDWYDDGADPVEIEPTTEELINGRIEESGRSYLRLASGLTPEPMELFRNSLLSDAILTNNLADIYILLKNNIYTATDLNNDLCVIPADSPTPEVYDMEGNPTTCDHPFTGQLRIMPLLAVALSQTPINYQTAVLLIDYGADLNAKIRDIENGSSQSMIDYFTVNNNTEACEFLRAHMSPKD